MRSQPLCRAVAVLTAVAMASACGSPTTQPPATHIVVVTAPTTSTVQPRLDAAAEEIVRRAAQTNHGSLDLVVAGDPADSRHVDLTPLRTTADGHSEIEHGPSRDGKVDAIVAGVRAALAALAPGSGAPDLLGAISTAARLGPPGVMVVADSGVSTTDPLDLRVLGWDQDPAGVVADLGARGFLPDLHSWTVRFTGLGHVAGTQPGLPPPQQRWLETLWTSLCRAGGASACLVAEPGRDATPASTRAVPPVPVPPVTTARDRDGSQVTTFPASSLGFTEGSSALAPGADLALGAVVAAARDGHHAVSVVGYVAYWGSAAYRDGLSVKRARAVADRLVALGVPADLITAVGAGAGDGPAASQTNGVFDEAKVQRSGLRRVVVTVRPISS
jgi:outer membrane protein OmpA-like peptidoglycan-associated protein